MHRFVVISTQNKIIEIDSTLVDDNGLKIYRFNLENLQDIAKYPSFESEAAARAYLITIKVDHMNDLRKELNAISLKIDAATQDLKNSCLPQVFYLGKD